MYFVSQNMINCIMMIKITNPCKPVTKKKFFWIIRCAAKCSEFNNVQQCTAHTHRKNAHDLMACAKVSLGFQKNILLILILT